MARCIIPFICYLSRYSTSLEPAYTGERVHRVLFMIEGKMEHETGRTIGAVSAVMQTSC